jgi:hypothetical protein
MQNENDKSQTVLFQRRGKIARLPRDVRDQLNSRLDDGHEADDILPWLNELPEVREVIAESFNGVPVSPQNLSAWRQGGFQEWLLRCELFDSTVHVHEHLEEIGEALDCDDSDDVPLMLADQMIAQLSIRFNAFMARWSGGPLDTEVAMLLKIGQFILKLQQGAYRAQRQGVQIAEARREAERKMEQEMWAEAYRDHLADRAKARKAGKSGSGKGHESSSEEKEAPLSGSLPAGGEREGNGASAQSVAQSGSLAAGGEKERGEQSGRKKARVQPASATGQSSSVKVNQGSRASEESPAGVGEASPVDGVALSPTT